MKIFEHPETREKTLSNIISIAFGVLLISFIFLFRDFVAFAKTLLTIIAPFLVAFALAFVIAGPMRFVEDALNLFLSKKKKRPRLCRVLSIVLCYMLFFALIVAFIWLIVPQLVISIRGLSINITRFFQTHASTITEFLNEYNITGENPSNVLITWQEITSSALNYAMRALTSLLSMSSVISNIVFQSFMSIILSIYMLFDKERLLGQSKKLAYAYIPNRRMDELIFWMGKSHGIFSNYVAGKLLESLIIGVLCYFGMVVFRMDYAVLISVIVGVTNIVPIIGPFIGGIIGGLILLIIDPDSVLWFALFILVLQQLDGNVIGPRILGGSTGLSAFWTVLAIVIGGGLFGMMGMLLSIPVFALFYAILKTVVEARLTHKSMPVTTQAYSVEGPVAEVPPTPPKVGNEPTPPPAQKPHLRRGRKKK